MLLINAGGGAERPGAPHDRDPAPAAPRPCSATAREVLEAAGARVLGTALGLDAVRIRAEGVDAADVLLRDVLLDQLDAGLRTAARTGGTPARPTPPG